MRMNNITLETTFIISSKMQYYDYFNQMKKQYAIEILFIYFNGFLKIASFYSILLGFNYIGVVPSFLTYQYFIALPAILTSEYNLNIFTLKFYLYKSNR